MPRFMLSDQHWAKLAPIFMQHDIYHKPNLRLTVEAMLYKMRVGCPWRDLPPEFGWWNSLYKRYNDWSAKGIFQSMFSILSADSDTEWVFIDGSYVKVHQHSAGAASHDQEAIGLSRGGKTTSIPRRKNSKRGNSGLDKCMYSLRHLVENMFARLKHFRAIATRYDKLKRNFVSLVALACAFIWLPM